VKNILVVPLSKSPHSLGRIGPIRWQDWFRGLKKAVSIGKKPKTKILVLSDVRVSGQPHEADIYSDALVKMGTVSFRVIRECYETIEQVNYSIDLALQERKKLVFISTFLHYPRVQWLIKTNPKMRLVQVKHYCAWGIPRPREAFTDLALMVIFPLIDFFGCRQRFIEATKQRRLSGKH